MSSKRFFKREYKLVIEDGQSGETYILTNLDIKFKAQKYVACVKFEAQIDILGLSKDVVNSLVATSLYDPHSVVTKLRKHIVLKAGYAGSLVDVFDGYVVHASVDSPPNMWVHLTVNNFIEDVHDVYDISCSKDMTINAVFDYVAQRFGWTPRNETTTSVMFHAGAFNVLGTKSKVMKQLQLMMPQWRIFYDNGLLYAVDKDSMDDKKKQYQKINRESGLLSVSGIDLVGGNFTTWLANDVPLSRWIDVESELYKPASGLYRVISKQFVGHFRGREWYTTYECLRNKKPQ